MAPPNGDQEEKAGTRNEAQKRKRKPLRGMITTSFSAHVADEVYINTDASEKDADNRPKQGQSSYWNSLNTPSLSQLLQLTSLPPSPAKEKEKQNNSTLSSLQPRHHISPLAFKDSTRQSVETTLASGYSDSFIPPHKRHGKSNMGQLLSAVQAQPAEPEAPHGTKRHASSSLGASSPLALAHRSKISQPDSSPIKRALTSESNSNVSYHSALSESSKASVTILQNPNRLNGTTSSHQSQNSNGLGFIPISKTPAQRPNIYKTYEADVYQRKDPQQRLVSMTIKLSNTFPDDVPSLGGELDPEQLRIRPKVYVFLDFSNIYAGAENFLRENPLGGHDKPVPVFSVDSLDLLLSRHRNVFKRYMATSDPGKRFASTRNEIESAKERGYEVRVLERVRGKEQGVDELLQKYMGEALLDHEGDAGIVVLATGDGNESDLNDGGFPVSVERYLKKGFKVELYAWEKSTSSRFFKLKERYPDQFRIVYLREWAKYIFEVRNKFEAASRDVLSSPKGNNNMVVTPPRRILSQKPNSVERPSHGKLTWGDPAWRAETLRKRGLVADQRLTEEPDRNLLNASPELEPAPILSTRRAKRQQENISSEPFLSRSN
jgi:hypothetical protein